MKMNLKELVEAVNKELFSHEYNDQRISTELTERRIRDYITKGIMDQGFKEGRNTYYNEEHLKQLIEIRKLQAKGISDKLLVNFSTSYAETNSLVDNNEDDLNSLLSGIEGRGMRSFEPQNLVAAASLSTKSGLYGSTASMIKEKFEVDSYEEYPLNKDKNIFLKIKSGTIPEDIDSSIEKAKKILTNKKD